MAHYIYERPRVPYLVEIKKGKTLLFSCYYKTATGARKGALYFMKSYNDSKVILDAAIYKFKKETLYNQLIIYQPTLVIHKKIMYKNFFDLRDIPNY